MALTKKTYTEGQTVITAKNLNDIQDTVISQGTDIDKIEDALGGDLTSKFIDYVVEEGADSIWQYRKWSSGYFECYGREDGLSLYTGWCKSSPLPFTPVGWSYTTVTHWYGINDNRSAKSTIITCGGVASDNTLSIYERNYDGSHATGYRAYNYIVVGRWK